MALYLRKKLDNKAEIAVWQVTETEEELLNITSVPNDELEEISLFRNESQRKQKLAVRALINEMFEEKMYLNHHDNGKPYLENCATNISITHTDKYVAVITHEEEEVGIDIESLERDFSAVEKKALSEDEIDDLEDEKKNEHTDILEKFYKTKHICGAFIYCYSDPPMCYYCGQSDCPTETRWGLVDMNGNPKPSYYAVQKKLAQLKKK